MRRWHKWFDFQLTAAPLMHGWGLCNVEKAEKRRKLWRFYMNKTFKCSNYCTSRGECHVPSTFDWHIERKLTKTSLPWFRKPVLFTPLASVPLFPWELILLPLSNLHLNVCLFLHYRVLTACEVSKETRAKRYCMRKRVCEQKKGFELVKNCSNRMNYTEQ